MLSGPTGYGIIAGGAVVIALVLFLVVWKCRSGSRSTSYGAWKSAGLEGSAAAYHAANASTELEAMAFQPNPALSVTPSRSPPPPPNYSNRPTLV
jgi:hypothetical protein